MSTKSGDPPMPSRHSSSFRRQALLAVLAATVALALASPTAASSLEALSLDLVQATSNATAAPPIVRILMPGSEQLIQQAGVDPQQADVVTTQGGRKVLAWSQLGGSGTIICIQYIEEDDVQRTPPRLANQSGAVNDQPSISADDRGNISIFWRQGAGTSVTLADGKVVALGTEAIVGRFFDNDSTQATTQDIVISESAAPKVDPKATTDKNGMTVVIWNEDEVVKARRLGPGGKGMGPIFDVNDSSASGAEKASVDSTASGEFVVVWKETRSGQGIRAQRYDDSGKSMGSPIVVTAAGAAVTPVVAVADDGGFAVAWESAGNILARSYDSDGEPRQSPFLVNQTFLGTQRRPAIDANAEGDFAIVWESDLAAKGASAQASSAQSGSLVGRFFDPTGTAETDEFEVATDVAGSPEDAKVSVDDKDTVTVTFDRRDTGGQPQGIFRREFRTERVRTQCIGNSTTLCLNGGRFRVTTVFEESASSGPGTPTQITQDTGYFTYFDAANVEVVVKVLDACGVNGRYWVFAAGLTDVEVDLRVEDTETGRGVSYFNRDGSIFEPVQDTAAFDSCSATKPGHSLSEAARLDIGEAVNGWLLSVAADPSDALQRSDAPSSAAACTASDTALCLTGSRFAVSSTFRTRNGSRGVGQAKALTPDTGYFWFFDEDNVEVVVKVLEACGVNDRYWVFAGGLTNVEVETTVEDTSTGQMRVYTNPLETPFQTVTDVQAFATCP